MKYALVIVGLSMIVGCSERKAIEETTTVASEPVATTDSTTRIIITLPPEWLGTLGSFQSSTHSHRQGTTTTILLNIEPVTGGNNEY